MTGIELATWALLGAVSGTLAGLLGIGGGIVIVPGLALLLSGAGIPDARLMQVAVGTSLATIGVTALASTVAHHRRGAVRWSIVAQLAPGTLLGAVIGALVAAALSTRVLATLFGGFLVLVAIRLIWSSHPSGHRGLPRRLGLAAWGLAIAGLASILGIGGGTLTVPLLRWCSIGMRDAVATAAAVGLPIAVTGAVAFIAAGWTTAGLPAGATGYVYWPAWATLAPLTVACAPLGARLAHTLPAAWLQRGFAVFALIVGLRMLWG